ncbi:hypothetical protein PTSG_02202 [Salpingoeca rosetta]|uniref:SAM-dependent MTase RsmB/NOP-type domain-containing protein n=1 Tax=Salpingoeca rosetta (strain ATCC 50818 / BSB-021) TaxID=946362 RepID=F2U1I3_SALR5|nr:uncharacterized protein PTSG_02202 [Salpingoeca rosetta]EGD81485.1 hypothetical protein PTSG_02202 [Salpingoeca rosetta]|eukprot:XP_004996689.1 hypothetical protein PTSG_02202 [Salpingoeca rosetta]
MSALYDTAAGVLERVRQHKGTIKTLCLEAEYKQKKKLLALVCQTLKYQRAVDAIIAKAQLLEKEPTLSKELARVLCHDLLIGGVLRCTGSLYEAIMRHKDELQTALADLMAERGVDTASALAEDTLAESMPRYARVNPLKQPEAATLTALEETGFQLQQLHAAGPKSTTTLESRQHYFKDTHLDNLLGFHPRTDFHTHWLYRRGHLILQDKASCFPAAILAPPPGSVCIDACAAPGNKTSHLAALMHNKGTVFAFDISRRRMGVMRRQLKLAGVTCVKTMLKSFLDTDPTHPKFRDVKYILCDPSCSGSGIVSRLSDLVDVSDAGEPQTQEEKQQERLKALAEFQVQVVNHALSFPNVERVTYSTCSVHQEENEDVVAAVLAANPSFELAEALPSWHRRGHSDTLPSAAMCVRTDPAQDFTNGFFVALFVRKPGAPRPQSQKQRTSKRNSSTSKASASGDRGSGRGEGTTTKRAKSAAPQAPLVPRQRPSMKQRQKRSKARLRSVVTPSH